ncbi:MAG: hypothetical protein PHC36_00835, partial [Eubacteriales bacterium]|nr:hypothetical protein [Eubacteriales bacterium]
QLEGFRLLRRRAYLLLIGRNTFSCAPLLFPGHVYRHAWLPSHMFGAPDITKRVREFVEILAD